MYDAAGIRYRIEGIFGEIAKKSMSGLPLVNPRLSIAAVDFQPWNKGHLGVLITPWCINLIWIPSEEDADRDPVTLGNNRTLSFPAGDYDFIAGHHPELGTYYMCSLFSLPMEFADQQAAVATASAALSFLLDDRTANIDTKQLDSEPPRDISRRAFLTGRQQVRQS